LRLHLLAQAAARPKTYWINEQLSREQFSISPAMRFLHSIKSVVLPVLDLDPVL
jgi:hypothetical protein